jgi:GNAT superfamily N-acetyltransferase
MIRRCDEREFDLIHTIINDGAQAYKGIIPEDCWTEPYMSNAHLRQEMHDGVVFWGFEESGELLGVMGIQPLHDVTLIRHAYVRSAHQRQGIGVRLLAHLRLLTDGPVLIGTWADAAWAIHFYEKNGFRRVSPEQKDRLITRYWKISERQRETSVVLADATWRKLNNNGSRISG